MTTIPAVLAVSDPPTRGNLPWLEWCGRCERSGADGLLAREREASDRELYDRARSARQQFGGAILVHRRFDIALAAEADGVHLPASGLPTAMVRDAAGDRLLIGRSTHQFDEVEMERTQASYVLFGPVFASPGKSALARDQSLELLSTVCRLGIPVIAIGGIEAGNVDDVVAAGVTGIAAIRAFADDRAAFALVESTRAAFDRVRKPGPPEP